MPAAARVFVLPTHDEGADGPENRISAVAACQAVTMQLRPPDVFSAKWETPVAGGRLP